MTQLSKFNLEKITKQELISGYEQTRDYKKYPHSNCISLLLNAGQSPLDGSIYYPMPMYETVDHLPFGDRHAIGQMVDFDGLKVGMTLSFLKEVDRGVICLIDHFIRVLPIEEFDERYLINGVCVDS